jgi:hypothetical protein
VLSIWPIHFLNVLINYSERFINQAHKEEARVLQTLKSGQGETLYLSWLTHYLQRKRSVVNMVPDALMSAIPTFQVKVS